MRRISDIADTAKKARRELELMNIGDAKEMLDRVINQLTSHPLIYVSVDDEQWAKDMKKVIEDAHKTEQLWRIQRQLWRTLHGSYHWYAVAVFQLSNRSSIRR